MATSGDLTPLEWVARLGPKLRARQPEIDLWQRYFEGDHDLPAGPQQHKEAYRRFQKLARTNLCDLCVNSRVHRTQAIGYRDGTTQGGNDAAVWALWQAARLDARQSTVYRKAWSLSEAYVIVGPDPKRAGRPRVTIEGPRNVIVETDPADSSSRLAALRLWHDPIVKRWMATLYLPGWRYAFQSVREFKDDSPGDLKWDPAAWTVRDEPARSTADVPVVSFSNGDEGERPRAAFDVGLDVQNRLNLTLLNRLTSERYGAFRQRYLMNYVPEEDPATGLPVPPFNPGADQTITIPPPEMPGDPEPKIGDLAQTDTSGMLRGAESDIRSFAAVTITPVYYLPGGDLTNIGADTIVALDAGHVASVREAMNRWGEGWEEVLQLMADVAGLEREMSSAEIVWARPEAFNPAAVADYLSKLVGAKMPLPLAVEQIGWTPQQIDRLRAEMAAEVFSAQLSATALPAAGTSSAQALAPATPANRPTPAPTPASATTTTRTPAPGQVG